MPKENANNNKMDKAEKNALTDGIATIVIAILALGPFGLVFSLAGLFFGIRGARKETKYRGLCVFGIVLCSIEALFHFINVINK